MAKKPNSEIRSVMAEYGCTQIELGELLGIKQSAISIKLMKELPIKEQELIIEKIKQAYGNGGN